MSQFVIQRLQRANDDSPTTIQSQTVLFSRPQIRLARSRSVAGWSRDCRWWTGATALGVAWESLRFASSASYLSIHCSYSAPNMWTTNQQINKLTTVIYLIQMFHDIKHRLRELSNHYSSRLNELIRRETKKRMSSGNIVLILDKRAVGYII